MSRGAGLAPAPALALVLLWLSLPGCLPALLPPAPPPTAMAFPPSDALAQRALEGAAGATTEAERQAALPVLIRRSEAPGGGAWGNRARFDPSPYVRRAAIGAWRARPASDAAATAHLQALTEDTEADPLTRGAAALAWLSRGEGARSAAAPAIQAAVAQVHGSEAAALLLAAAEAGDAAALERLGGLCRRSELPLELWVYAAMGESGLTALAPSLEAGLAVAEPEARAALAGALAQLGGAAGVTALEAALQGGVSEAGDAVQVLEGWESEASSRLLKRATHHRDSLIRSWAELALVARGQAPLSIARDGLGSSATEVQQAAARAAGERLRRAPSEPAAAEVRAALRGLLGAEQRSVQIAAIRALAGSPEEADRAALRALLGSEEPLLRVESAAALSW